MTKRRSWLTEIQALLSKSLIILIHLSSEEDWESWR
jgi:hypothetical protein